MTRSRTVLFLAALSLALSLGSLHLEAADKPEADYIDISFYDGNGLLLDVFQATPDAAEVLSYSISGSTHSIVVDALPRDPENSRRVSINGTEIEFDSPEELPTQGALVIRIEFDNGEGSSRSYMVTLVRTPVCSDVFLSSLTGYGVSSDGRSLQAEPVPIALEANRGAITIPASSAGVTFIVEPNSQLASTLMISQDGEPYYSSTGSFDSLEVAASSTTFTLVVTAENQRTVAHYTVEVFKESTFSSVATSQKVVAWYFDDQQESLGTQEVPLTEAVTGYKLEIPSAAEFVAVEAVADDDAALVEYFVNGTPISNEELMDVGSLATLEIRITAEDGTQVRYLLEAKHGLNLLPLWITLGVVGLASLGLFVFRVRRRPSSGQV